MLVKLVWMDDMSVHSVCQVGISLFFGLGSQGEQGSSLFLQVGISSGTIKDLWLTRPALSFPILCLQHAFSFFFFFCSESMPERGNVLKGRENTPVFLSVLLVQD